MEMQNNNMDDMESNVERIVAFIRDRKWATNGTLLVCCVVECLRKNMQIRRLIDAELPRALHDARIERTVNMRKAVAARLAPLPLETWQIVGVHF